MMPVPIPDQTIQQGDARTVNVLADLVPETLEVFIASRSAPTTALSGMTLTGSSITGGRSYALTAEQSLALSPRRAYQLVVRDPASGVTWATGVLFVSTDGAASTLPSVLTLVDESINLYFDLILAAGAGADPTAEIAAAVDPLARLWPVSTLLVDITFAELVALIGWENVQSGIIWDTALRLIDADAETSTVITPAENDLALIVAVFDGNTFTATVGGVQRFTPDLAADGPWYGAREAAQVITEGTGLDLGLTQVEAILLNHEGTMDRHHWVSAIFTGDDLDLTSVVGVPVAVQPTGDYGIQPSTDSDVWVKGRTDPAEDGLYRIEGSDGSWSKYEDPDVFDPPGNGATRTLTATGSPEHGWWWRYVDSDPASRRRVSYAYPASATGEWIGPFTPAA